MLFYASLNIKITAFPERKRGYMIILKKSFFPILGLIIFSVHSSLYAVTETFNCYGGGTCTINKNYPISPLDTNEWRVNCNGGRFPTANLGYSSYISCTGVTTISNGWLCTNWDPTSDSVLTVRSVSCERKPGHKP
ncbi:hypothetical protein BH10PSE19_BH10PSE19_04300 [soil metagenome]